MNPNSNMSIPPWLAASNSAPRLAHVYHLLADREAKRLYARHSSILPVNPGNTVGSATHATSSRRKTDEHLSSHYSVAIAHRRENQPGNRYTDIEPYDRTRVLVDGLSEGHDDLPDSRLKDEHGKYMNASWILERYGHKWWIATQAPLPNTAHTFLSIFFQSATFPPPSLCPAPSPRISSRIRTVVQLTRDLEGGRRKAHAYFPYVVGKSLVVSPKVGDSTAAFKVTLLQRRAIEEAQCVQSTISVVPISRQSSVPVPRPRHGKPEDDGSEKSEHQDDTTEDIEKAVTFQHMLYTSWPDHGVPQPEDRDSLLKFIHLVDRTNRDTSLVLHPDGSELDADPPIIVGCSAGVGRTGSFIALSSLLRQLNLLPAASSPTPASVLPPSPLGDLPSKLREDLVALEIDSLREQRPSMVQREEQIQLIYEILAGAFL